MFRLLSTLTFALLVVYLICLLYPFYQRYWASITYGDAANGKKYVNDLETMAYGLSFADAAKLADELRKPVAERKVPDIFGIDQYGIGEAI